MNIRRPKDLGRLIRTQRTAQRLNQQQLADRLGVSRSWINELEAGKPTVQLNLVLRTLNELGIALTASTAADRNESLSARQNRPLIDIDDIADTGLDETTRKTAS